MERLRPPQLWPNSFQKRRAVPKKTREPIAAGGLDDPAARFRLFTAECLELAQKTSSLEKRRVYLDLARACFRLALRWEKGSDGAL